MPLTIPQPTKEQWELIDNGVPEFPKLFDFKNEQAQAQAIRELNSSKLADKKVGKGPPAYEEAHRQFAGWDHYTKIALGMPSRFIRLRSQGDIDALTNFALTMCQIGCEPHEYLKAFVTNLSQMREFLVGRLQTRYVFSDNTISAIGAKLVAKKAGLDKQRNSRPGEHGNGADKHHSFNAVTVDPSVRQTLELAGFTNLTDSQVCQAQEAVKLIRSGAPTYISRSVRSWANALIESERT